MRIFQHIETTPSHSIIVGDGKALKVKGIGSVSICSSKGKIITLNNVQFVPNLAHNLLSVGQMMDSRFDMEFTRGVYNIKETESKARVAQVCMTAHRLFPLEADDVRYAYVAQNEDVYEIWHKRYGHINLKSLKQLSNKQLVFGLINITSVHPCEACSQGK